MAEPSTATGMVRVPILGENGRISDDYIPEAIPQAVTAVKRAAEAAASSANDALQQAAAAEKAASSATSSVEQAKTYASNASTYMTTAESHAESAATDATAAAQSASDAAASAEAAAQSASSIGTAAKDAQAAATAAKESASQAATSASEASASATAADDASQDAETSATNAKASETAASSSASQAATSATQASSSATAAAGSATNAAGSATAAEKSKNDAQAILNEANAKFIESATATTLDPGQPATAEVVDNVLNLGIPQGEKGDKGDTGTGVPDGGTPGQLLSKTGSGTAWVDPPSTGNVPKRTVTDLVAHGEDAYAQKPIEVRVKGRTVKNLWPSINVSNGTVTTDETGLITVNATPESTLYVNVQAQGIAANKSYTLTASNVVNASISTWMIYAEERDVTGAYVASHALSSNQPTTTFTTAENCAQLVCMIVVYTGYSANLTTRVMLVEGTEVPDCFTPPASITSVQTGNLVTSGKNLLETSVIESTSQFVSELLPAGNYMFSCIKGGTHFNIKGFATKTTEGGESSEVFSIVVDGSGPKQVKIESDRAFYPYVNGYSSSIVNELSNMQLELGSTATAYEPPNITTTHLPEVELWSLPNGTCDELVIGADGTCRVERRSYKYTATGEESVSYGGGKATFTVLGITQSGLGTSTVFCDKLTAMDNCANTTGCNISINGLIEFNVLGTTTDVPTAKAWLVANRPTFVFIKNDMETEPQASVTLPTLPTPTFNQYHDSDVSSNTSTTYARDINIVLANLEAVQTALLGGE